MLVCKEDPYFFKIAAKQVRASPDEGATVNLVPRGEALNARKPVKDIIVENVFKLKSFKQDGKVLPIERFNVSGDPS